MDGFIYCTIFFFQFLAESLIQIPKMVLIFIVNHE